MTSAKSAVITGQGTATATATSLLTLLGFDSDTPTITLGFYLAIPSTLANGVEIIGLGLSTGMLAEPGPAKFYPATDLRHVQIKRIGGSDVSFSVYAF